MGLASSLFSGISGLSVLGNAMTVIGDNIANVNTVGFKASRVTFQDVLSQSVATTAGTTQVGRGTSLADISSSFAQGSFESTDSATDLAIGGEGFFIVRDPSTDENQFYTRAGEFSFDKDGNFVNPAGYIVRGWELDEDTGEDIGSITDIILQSFTSSPKKTDIVTAITNLNKDANSKTISLSNLWDGTATTPIGSTNYEYQSTVKAYDTLGSTHDITIYYDMVSGTTWEYIVTCNPSEDGRTGFTNTTSAGLLARGNVTFSETSGTITAMTMDTLGGVTDGHIQSYGTPTVTNTGLGTLTDSDVSVAYNNQIALTTSGTITMEFDQVTDQAITGSGTITTLTVNNDAALTKDTSGTPFKVTKTPLAENEAITNGGTITTLTVNEPAALTIAAPSGTPFKVTKTPLINNLADTVTGTATAVLNNLDSVDDDATDVTLTWVGASSKWTVTGDGGFTGGIDFGVSNTSTKVDLDLGGGSGTNDITITLPVAANNGETVTFDLDKDNWRVTTTPAGYSYTAGDDIGGTDAGVFELDLNNDSTTDITVTTNTTVGGTEVTFEIDPHNWRVTTPAGYSYTAGDDIGGTSLGVFELDLNGDLTADITVDTDSTAPGDEVTFETKPLNWICKAVPDAYDLDTGDTASSAYINSTSRTGYALNLGDPSGDDLTVTLAANAAEGDQVSFTITSSDNWATATPDKNGYLVFQPDFLGGTGTDMDIELDFGSHYSSSSSSWENDALTSTQFARASTTTFQSANGYGAGDLQSVTVGIDGAITGQYSNGQVLPLYRVALAKFQNDQGLFKVGGNLFRETRLSGDPITGRPGTSGLGSISPNSLEQSNTDIATEFVKMITTQRGFQANSKIITVTDQMLEELIRLKR